MVGDITTLRWHMLGICSLTIFTSKNIYHKWTKAVNFDSMLPDNTKACQKKITKDNVCQSHVDEHFKDTIPEDKPQPYSNEILNEAMREWLIETTRYVSSR